MLLVYQTIGIVIKVDVNRGWTTGDVFTLS